MLIIILDEFRSKIACENDNVKLVCNPYSRVVIYSASFGYMERDVVQCSGNRNTTVPTYHSINDGTSDVNKSSKSIILYDLLDLQSSYNFMIKSNFYLVS